MRTCFNTITAGPDARLEEIIAACGHAGFAGIEIDQRHLAACLERLSVAALKERLAAARLRVASLMAFSLDPFGDAERGRATIRDAARQAAEMGAPILLTYCAANIPEGMSAAEAQQRAAARAALYADAAAPIAIALEPIGRTTVMGDSYQTLAIARLAGRANIGVMLDTFHFYLSQLPVAAIGALPRDSLLIVHINDAEDRPIAELQDRHRLYPGLGILPLQEYLRQLREIGYDGYVSAELFRPEYWAQPVEQVVVETKRTLDAAFAGAGVAA